jgi:transcriptional regulator with GAF, ATPase, and Fis domain
LDLPKISGGYPLPDRSLLEEANDSEPPVLTEAEVVLNQKKNMRAALVRTNWKIYGTDGAAGLLGIKPTTLIERMKKFGLKKPV